MSFVLWRNVKVARYAAYGALASPVVAFSLSTRNPLRAEAPPQRQDGTVKTITKRQLAQTIINQKTDEKGPKDEKSDSSWLDLSAALSLASDKMAGIADKVSDYVLPDWTRRIPGALRKLKGELDMDADSLSREIWTESEDPSLNPEIVRDATVRTGRDLCSQEKAFLQARRLHMKKALAKYLDVSEDEVEPEDIPTIAMCASGGGLRALIAGTSSYLCSQDDGLFDCVTYTAGVSGSCWMQALFHSSIGKMNHHNSIEHLKHRLGVHIAFPPKALDLLISAPTNKFLLTGLVEKLKADDGASFGLVDIYGMLLAARLLIPRGDLDVNPGNLKLSNQAAMIADGRHPLPIYTAVRHEIPLSEMQTLESETGIKDSEDLKKKAQEKSWFQWFELTPHEFWCEEIEAGIPVWSLGRHFENGFSKARESGYYVPETRLPQLLGIWGSAFCASLAHYYKEIRPLAVSLSGFSSIDELLAEKDDDLVKVHPISPAGIPNFARGLQGKLPPTCPQSLYETEYLELMDAGMSNNLPIYPLLRPGRDVDVVIAFDASADIKQENWLSIADGYVQQRGIRGWPIGAGWPRDSDTKKSVDKELEAADHASPEQATENIAKAREKQRRQDNKTEEAIEDPKSSTGTPGMNDAEDNDLTYCNVWIGTVTETVNISRTENAEEHYSPSLLNPKKPVSPYTKPLSPDSLDEPLSSNSGIAVVYFPLLPNESKAPGVDPNTSDFMSTWNFIYTREQIDQVVGLARANYDEGKEQVRRVVRAVWERKRRARIAAENERDNETWRKRLKREGNNFK